MGDGYLNSKPEMAADPKLVHRAELSLELLWYNIP